MTDNDKLNLAMTIAPLATQNYDMLTLFNRLMADIYPPTPHRAEGPSAGSADGDGASPQVSAETVHVVTNTVPMNVNACGS